MTARMPLPSVGFQLTPNRKGWTGWRNSPKLFWTITHGTERQDVSSPTRPAVGTWGRAYCKYITKPKDLLTCDLLQFLLPWICDSTLEAAFKWQVDELTSGFRFFISELQEMSLFFVGSVSLLKWKCQITNSWQGKTLCILCWFIFGRYLFDFHTVCFF